MNNPSILSDLKGWIVENKEEDDTSNYIEEEDLRRKKEQVETVLVEKMGYVPRTTVSGWIEIEPFSLFECIAELQRENNHLQQQIEELKSKVEQLAEGLPTQKTVILRQISKAEAKQEIKELFDSANEPLYYSDIAEKLQLNIEMVVEICEELIEEGEIEIDTNVL